MALSGAQLATVQIHKRIAERARSRMSDLDLKSANKPWNLNKAERNQQLTGIRAAYTPVVWSDISFLAQTTTITKIGNCFERACVFANYARQEAQAINYQCHIYRVSFYAPLVPGIDHVVAVLVEPGVNLVICNEPPNQTYNFDALGTTGIVLDGWTEDWYLPNIGKTDKLRNNCWRMGTPFAEVTRIKYEDVPFYAQTSV
jgi:hypothetical protein